MAGVAAKLTSQPHAGVVDVFGEDGRREPGRWPRWDLRCAGGCDDRCRGVGGVSPLARGTALTRWSYRRSSVSSVRMTPAGKCQGGERSGRRTRLHGKASRARGSQARDGGRALTFQPSAPRSAAGSWSTSAPGASTAERRNGGQGSPLAPFVASSPPVRVAEQMT